MNEDREAFEAKFPHQNFTLVANTPILPAAPAHMPQGANEVGDEQAGKHHAK